jgi:hypothetical protein
MLNKSNMKLIAKNFWFKTFLFILIVVVLDFAIGSLIEKLYFKQTFGAQYRTTYALDSVKSDILVLGSSRANHHYHPVPFSSNIKMSFYNAGRDGNHIFYHYSVLKSNLKRYKPKLVIFDLSPNDFDTDPDAYARISSLLPYYNYNPEIRPVIELRSKYENLKLFSKIYPFNSQILTIMGGILGYGKDRKADIKGYLPVAKIWNKPINRNKQPYYEIDTVKVFIFKEIIRECKNNNVNIIVVSSPYFRDYSDGDETLNIGKTICQENNILIFDYFQSKQFITNRKLFGDVSHMNDRGAELFSKVLVDTLLKRGIIY